MSMPAITTEQWQVMQQSVRQIYEDALSQAPEMTLLAEGIKDDAIDVNDILSATARNSEHADSDLILGEASSGYHNLISAIHKCTSCLSALIETQSEAIEYLSALPLRKRREEFTKAEISTLLKAADLAQSLQTTRMLSVGVGLLNFYESVKALDRAQATILRKGTRLDQIKSSGKGLIKAGLTDGAGSVVPFLGTLIAIAEAATPNTDKQIEALSSALGTLKALFIFKDITQSEQPRCEFALQVFETTLVEERDIFEQLRHLTKDI